MPLLTPQDVVLPIPTEVTEGDAEGVRWAIELAVARSFLPDIDPTDSQQWEAAEEALLEAPPVVIVLDEVQRASKLVFNAIMEPLSEGTLGGVSLLGHVAGFILTDNLVDNDAYLGLSSFDDAQADRVMRSTRWTAADTGWRPALAAKFPKRNLNPFFELWDTLPSYTRDYVLVPRVLEHMLLAAESQIPLDWVLPIAADGRQEIPPSFDEDGNPSPDEFRRHTTEVLARFSRALGVPTDAELRESRPELDSDPVRVGFEAALQHGVNLRVVGSPGVGKSSYIKALIAEVTKKRDDVSSDVHALSLPVVSPVDLALPVPVETPTGLAVDMAVAEVLRPGDDGKNFVLLLDEYSRASRDVLAMSMGITQEHRIAAMDLSIASVVALDNPTYALDGTDREVNISTTAIDLAQASRFPFSVEISSEQIPWAQYLRRVYGDGLREAGLGDPTVFSQWWYEHLTPASRASVTPRKLEHMMIEFIVAHKMGDIVDLEACLSPDLVGKVEGIGFLYALLRGEEVLSVDSISDPAKRQKLLDALDADAAEGKMLDGEGHQAVLGLINMITDPAAIEEHESAFLEVMQKLCKPALFQLTATPQSVRATWIKLIARLAAAR